MAIATNNLWIMATLLAGSACSLAQVPAAPPAAQPAPSAPAAPTTPRPRLMKSYSKTPYLGVNIEDVSPDRVGALKLKEARGVEVTLVDADAAAGKAGIRVHDVIVSYNGNPVEGMEQLRRMIRETPVGRTVQIGVMRDGNPLNLSATIGSHADMDQAFMMHEPIIAPMPPVAVHVPDMDIPQVDVVMRTYAPRTGMVVESLTPQLAEFFGSKSGEGVLVRSVEGGSAAQKAGLRAGDVIVRVGDEKIVDRSDLSRAMRNRSGDVKVGILRDKREQSVTLHIPEKHSEMKGQTFSFDAPAVSVDMQDLEQLKNLQLFASNESMRFTAAQQREIRREMERARKELQREMKEMQREMRDEVEE